MSDETTQEAPRELRDRLAELVQDVEKQTERADAAETNFRGLQATVTFEASGLTAKHAELFLKTNPEAEVTAEAAKAFAEEYGLTVAQAPEGTPVKETTPDPGESLAGFGGAAGSETAGSTPAAQPQMSVEDFEGLLVTNPQEAAKAYVEGRVPRNKDNVQARDLVTKGIISH